jgi:periplasmic protein TonB
MNSKKSQRADLENKRSIFMEIGMIVALSIALLAFNWKTYEQRTYDSFQRGDENIPEELVAITVQKQPELPKVKLPPVITAINIVEDDDLVDEDYYINAEADPMDTVPVYVPPVKGMNDEPVPEEEEIFKVVESWPAFPGGDQAMYAFLGKNLRYPQMALETGISGKVFLTFVVEKDGSITDIQLVRGIGGGCDEEAMRVVTLMPKWTPGKQRGIPVRVQYLFSVKFTLQLR